MKLERDDPVFNGDNVNVTPIGDEVRADFFQNQIHVLPGELELVGGVKAGGPTCDRSGHLLLVSLVVFVWEEMDWTCPGHTREQYFRKIGVVMAMMVMMMKMDFIVW